MIGTMYIELSDISPHYVSNLSFVRYGYYGNMPRPASLLQLYLQCFNVISWLQWRFCFSLFAAGQIT
jgi:hypothetical protein